MEKAKTQIFSEADKKRRQLTLSHPPLSESRKKDSWEICLVQNVSPDGPLNGTFTVIPTRKKQSGGHPATRLLCSQAPPPRLTRRGGYGQAFYGLRAWARKMPAVASASILRGLDVSPTQDLNECMPPRFIRACDDNAVRTMPERGSLFEPANFCLGKNAGTGSKPWPPVP